MPIEKDAAVLFHSQFAAAKRQEIQQRRDMLSAKLSTLEQQKITETRAEEIFRLNALIQQTKAMRDQVEQEAAQLQEQAGTLTDGDAMSASKKTKILFLSANPRNTSRLRLDEEVRSITTNLKLAKEREHLILIQEWAVTPDSLMQAVLDESPDIVHFSGHGETEGICLEDAQGQAKFVSAEALANLFRLFKDTVRCVLLNACYSETQARAVTAHIPYVIGMSSSIPDMTAIAFATGFYKAIGAGKTIPFAYELGKAAIQLQGESGVNLPVLL